VATITVAAPSQKMDRGDAMQLVATALDSKSNVVPGQSFVWSSSSTSTATVSGSGLVTARRSGSVTITAQASGKGGSLQIDVK
jgi:uncharacterized protein YjdB